MTEQELHTFLQGRYPKENARCEWKEFKVLKNFFNGKEGEDVMSYISAISNMEGGYLVIGVEDKTLRIVGTDISTLSLNNAVATIESAKYSITRQCTNLSSEGLEIEEYITSDTQKRVWIIGIPKHQPRLPVYAHKKAWQRIGDSLCEMTPERINAILNESLRRDDDWSAQIIESAVLDDLDPEAIAKARAEFKKVFPQKANEVDGWDEITFLNKAKITRQGRITNAAIILLGREESEHFLSPAVCKIKWMLRDGGDENKDFKIFSIPMILAVDEIASRIRNTSYSYTIEGSLFPDTMMRYDVFSIREPLNNAIGHQDYSLRARIEIVEYEDEKLVFRNRGRFIPTSIESVVKNDYPVLEYNNPFLIEAMRNVNMVETEGGGIRKLFIQQKKRFFPMPIYDISNNQVACEIQGKILDESFAKILVNNPNLSLQDIILLDKVQKHEALTDDAIQYLRQKKFVEGRKNSLYLSQKVVADSKHIELKATYIKNKSFDDNYYKDLVVKYIAQFGKASRADIDALLTDKLPEMLNERQKYDKITNLLASLRKEDILKVEKRKWVLVKS